MLQLLRNKAQSTFIQIIVVIIALVFIFWGVGANLSGDRTVAISVNDEEISFLEFQRAYDQAYQRLSDQFGGNIPKGLADALGIRQQVINQLVQTALLRQGAAEMGIIVSSEEIRLAIERMTQFQENGVFNMDKYKSVLTASRLAPVKFEQSMKTDRLAQVAIREIGSFAALTTRQELEEIYSQLNEKINVQFVQFAPAAFKEQVVADETKVKEWFETRKDVYKTEPERKVKYLPFVFADVGSKIDIDPARIEKYYQNNLTQFQQEEQRKARHILINTNENDTPEQLQKKSDQAENILQLAKDGNDFAELARQYSEGPSKTNGGDLGYFTKGRMAPAFEEAVFALGKGEISKVIKTPFGYHVILVEDIIPANTKTLEESTETINRILQEKEARSLAFQLANAAYEGIIGAGSLAAYAEKTPDADIRETGFFTRTTAPEIIKKDNKFLGKAFELGKGELSSLVKGDTGYVILYVEDVKAPAIPNFETVKEKVTADFTKEEASRLAKEKAESFLAKVQDSKKLEETAKAEQLQINTSGFFGKNTQSPESTFPAPLRQASFLLSSSAPVAKEVGSDGNTYYVYRLLERELPQLPENSEEEAAYRANLISFKQQQILEAWLVHLENKATITRHQSL